VTDLQNAAYEAEGGLNGTPRYNRARGVAAYGEDFLHGVKAQAQKQAPEAIRALNDHDRTVSALLRMRTVLDQRLNNATQMSIGGLGEGPLGRFVHAAAHPKATLTREALAMGARAGIGAYRGVLRGSRALEEADNTYAVRVLRGMQRGLP